MQVVSRFTQLLISERNAALLLHIMTAEILALRNAGYLPKPRLIGGSERREVETLSKIANSEMAKTGRIEW